MRLEELSPEVVAIIVDIEGTVSDAGFTRDVLIPYAESHLGPWIERHAERPDVAEALEALAQAAGEPEVDVPRLIELAEFGLVERDSGPVAALCHLLWRDAYQAFELTGHVYDDAVAALQAWTDDHRALFTYSAAPSEAQRLLLAYSEFGDISGLFSGFFDRRIGAKKNADSYTAIAQALGENPGSLLFISDTRGELDAAKQAGLQTCWIARDEETQEKAASQDAHQNVASFSEIELL
ncbi:acireductone synthase [Salinisphaera hydrothermalis]|uniref:2,3-diketo-5-methylthio-1-phosphopentane phosphatase n=1 Tax=Salinisphaera hydrothermalis (strain C41B8) TaxID=1304275 RepID=A0A084IM07_SALHC|nr:acireductone synthase [Salinisphaera hydrothermalis]KEZ77741.1 2,3-diketo-5-methylthio-1-phosphopentane phosphatase [Salinisphaera hydrothermalis C41B8]